LIIRCGQHSLQIFCLGIVLSVLGYIVLTSVRADVPMQLAVDLAGILLMVAVAELLTRYKTSSDQSAALAVSTASAARRGTFEGVKRHAVVWSLGFGSIWERSKRGLALVHGRLSAARGEPSWSAAARRSPITWSRLVRSPRRRAVVWTREASGRASAPSHPDYSASWHSVS
jgi:hypothetical protein